MAETRFTPGPWTHGGHGGGGHENYIYCDDATGSAVAQVEFGGTVCRSKTEAMANARLIAAAPELFEALNSLLSYVNRDAQAYWTLSYVKALKHADAAIAKAVQK